MLRTGIDYQLGNTTNAVASLHAIADEPDLDSRSLIGLGQLALAYGEPKIVRKAYVALIEREPEDPHLLQEFVFVLARDPETLPVAEKFAVMMTQKFPDTVLAAGSYGAVLLLKGPDHIHESLHVFLAHCEQFPMSGPLASQCGRAYELAGKPESARKYYERAVSLGFKGGRGAVAPK